MPYVAILDIGGSNARGLACGRQDVSRDQPGRAFLARADRVAANGTRLAGETADLGLRRGNIATDEDRWTQMKKS